MKKLSRLMAEQGIGGIVTVATASVAVVLLIVSFFLPSLFDRLADIHAFEILVLTMLLTLVARTRQSATGTGVVVVANDSEGTRRLQELLDQGAIRRADVLGAGLSARYPLIASMVNQGIRVRVLVQHNSVAIDKADAARLPASLASMYRVIDLQDASKRANLTLSYSMNTATMRAVVLYGPGDSLVAALMTWYVYLAKNTVLVAAPGPALFVTDAGPEGRMLLKSAADEFSRCFAEAVDDPGGGAVAAGQPSKRRSGPRVG